MSLTVISIAGVCAIGLAVYPVVSAQVKRRSSREESKITPTAREELRRITNVEDVPDVMPKGVRRANALNTADELDHARFDSADQSNSGDSGGDGE